MGHHYTDASRESGTYLPDLETWEANVATWTCCDATGPHPEGGNGVEACPECSKESVPDVGPSAWWVWSCFPGCMPDGPPDGPHATEADALASARESAGYCPHGVPDGAPCDECPAPELWALCDDAGRFYYPAVLDASPVKSGPLHCGAWGTESAALASHRSATPITLRPVRLTPQQARTWGTSPTE